MFSWVSHSFLIAESRLEGNVPYGNRSPAWSSSLGLAPQCPLERLPNIRKTITLACKFDFYLSRRALKTLQTLDLLICITFLIALIGFDTKVVSDSFLRAFYGCFFCLLVVFS